MIRADLTPSSPHASVFVTQAGSVVFRKRLASEAAAEAVAGATPERAATWLRLQRAGAVLSAFSSSDGHTWTPAGSAVLPMGQAVWAGLAVASADDGTHGDLATARFESTTLVAQSLPAPWAAADVGTPPAAGRAAYADGVFTVEGGGDVWNTGDDFHLAYQAVPGDGAITARVTALDGLHPWAKAGVMLRAGLAPGAPNVFLAVTEGQGIYLQYRLTAGAPSEALTVSEDSGTPVWLRLRRAGNRVTAEASADGRRWRAVGSVTLSLGAAIAGLAVSSADYGERQDLARGVFRSVTVVGGAPQAVEAPPAQARGRAVPFGVEAVFPEPSAGRFTVRLGLDRPGRVRVEAFDALGRQVYRRDVPEQDAGVLQVPVDLGGVSPGLYVLRVSHLDTGSSVSHRLTVAR